MSSLGALRPLLVALLAAALLLVMTGPAAAENPVLDAEGDLDMADALAEATQVQGVCYGYVLQVSDSDTGQFSGTYASSSTGAGRRLAASTSACPNGSVEVQARMTYTSAFSEAQDSASWLLAGTVTSVTIADVERLIRGSARDLLDDARSETVLLNAVLALPVLASERSGFPPVLLEPNSAPLPADARPTGRPGSDWLRQNAGLLVLCALAIGAGAVILLVSRPPRPRTGPPRTFGPQPVPAEGPAEPPAPPQSAPPQPVPPQPVPPQPVPPQPAPAPPEQPPPDRPPWSQT